MKLSQALRLEKAPFVALVGAGGKTTALHLLADELQPSLVTATTHLGHWQVKPHYKHFIWKADAPMPDIETSIGAGVTLITAELDGDRYQGLSVIQLELLKEITRFHGLPLLIEADGSRKRPLKAPAELEPAIPDFADTVIVVTGLDGLGKPLTKEYTHRPELFAGLSGLKINDLVTFDALSIVFKHPKGGLKNIPVGARRIALLNQADTPKLQALGKVLAQSILTSYDSVIIAALNPDPKLELADGSIFATHEKTAGILLAAGESTRFGQPKQLLDYRGKPFIKVVAEIALSSGLDPVVVVTGAYGEDVSATLQDLPVKTIQNPEWKIGQSTSIKAGLAGLPATVGASIFLLADQPQMTAAIIRSLIERHAQDLPSVLAPFIDGRRANPVLFDQRTFPDLMKLEADQGGRAIFSKYSPTYLEWADERLLLDVDTPEDYRRLLETENDG
jgi:molybdenum cofactor cytidylyltransferase